MEKREGAEHKDFLPRMGAGCLGLIGVVIVISAIVAGGEEGDLIFGILFGAVGVGLAAAGVFWYRFVAAREHRGRTSFEDKTMLGLAAKHGGHLTLAKATLESSFTAEEAEQVLARLVRQGFARPEILGDGTICYRFGGLIEDRREE